jgi:hypothetical protein
MVLHMRRWWHPFLAVVLILAGFVAPGPAAAAPPDDIAERLRAIPGLTIVGQRVGPPEYRLYSLTYRQPVDHNLPSGATFVQRFTLLHKATDLPMVLHTSGYDVYFDRPYRSEPTSLLGANQISVEQRFFTPSRPAPADWSTLNIWQAATDHHRIIAALKPIYGRRWISTGESKGGMASVYHRRFYPSDVDATVAYVAPNDAVDDVDVYTRFLDTVGNDPACRAAWRNLQREVLRRRAEMVSRYSAWARDNNRTFDRSLGSADRAFEALVLEAPFLFWQYGFQHHCRVVPPVTASTDQLYNYLDRIAGFGTYTDQGVEKYIPYYFQAGTQLGYPLIEAPHLAGLRRYPGVFSPRSFVPRDIPMRYEPGVMADVDRWVREQGRALLFVYGQNDPWAAEPFELGPGTRDSLWFQAPGGNHGTDIVDLPAADRAAATAAVRRWAGLGPAAATAEPAGDRDRWAPRRRL